MPRAIIDLPVYGSAAVIYIFFIQPRLTVLFATQNDIQVFYLTHSWCLGQRQKRALLKCPEFCLPGESFFPKQTAQLHSAPVVQGLKPEIFSEKMVAASGNYRAAHHVRFRFCSFGEAYLKPVENRTYV